MRPVVYIAGPYSQGDVLANIRRASVVGRALMDAGISPIVPHWDAVMVLATGQVDYETVLDADLAIVAKCDLVLRLSGHSPGGDREVAFARGRKIPVFFAETDEDVERFILQVKSRDHEGYATTWRERPPSKFGDRPQPPENRTRRPWWTR